MPEFALSKFVPLPDISPLQKLSKERRDFHLSAADICSVDTIESFPSEQHCCKRSLAETVELIRGGDTSFRAGLFREAVVSYTDVLQRFGACCPSLSATCFAKRSATFAMMAYELCVRPVTASALFGMDATRLAEMALKDAEKITEMFPQQSEGYLRTAFAYYLSEQYKEALEACLEGFRWNFTSRPLQECLNLVERQLMSGCPKGSSDNKEPSLSLDGVGTCEWEDFECKLCLQLLYEPVTTPCGHSFCSSCIQRSLDHSNKCPMCRRVMHVSRTLPVTVTLKNIVSRLFGEEYRRRELELNKEIRPRSDEQTCTLPLFVLFTLFPGEKMSLNVFEPRYRLMIRRVMEGNRRFGMIQSCQSETGICPCGTECEIVECEPLADGRYILEVIGRRRFKVLEMTGQDGYRVVKAQYFQDRPVVNASEEMSNVERHTEMIEGLVKSYRERGLFHRQSGSRWDATERSGEDVETMSFMACALLVDPDGSSARRRYLETRSTLQRMEWILQGSHYP